MQCPKCNLEIPDSSQICPNCGVDIPKIIEENSKTEQYDWKLACCWLFWFFISLIILGSLLLAIDNLGSEKVLLVIVSLFVIILPACFSKYAKDVVIKVGRKTLDICTVIDVILCLICIGVGFFQCVDEYGVSPFIWWYVLGSVVIFLITLLANYTLYLLIDIRDSLKKLADNIDNEGE